MTDTTTIQPPALPAHPHDRDHSHHQHKAISMTATITRSVGVVPQVNGIVVPCWPLPGGGYEGKTKRLDRAVANGAKWLAKTFGRPVTIRFNADQHSGGAFLVDKKHQDAGIKLGAHVVVPTAVWARWKAIPSPRRVYFEDFWHPDETTPIKLDAFIITAYLKNPTLAGDEPWAREFFTSSRQARGWLLQHVDMAKVLQAIPAPAPIVLSPRQASKLSAPRSLPYPPTKNTHWHRGR